MPDLPEVDQSFVVDVTAYLAGLREAIAMAKDFAAAAAEAKMAVSGLADTMDTEIAAVTDFAAAMETAAGRADDVRNAMAGAATATEDERDAAVGAARATGDLRDEMGAAAGAAGTAAGAADRLTGGLRNNAGAAAQAAWGEREFATALLNLDEGIIAARAGLHDYTAVLRDVAAMTAAAETEVKLLQGGFLEEGATAAESARLIRSYTEAVYEASAADMALRSTMLTGEETVIALGGSINDLKANISTAMATVEAAERAVDAMSGSLLQDAMAADAAAGAWGRYKDAVTATAVSSGLIAARAGAEEPAAGAGKGAGKKGGPGWLGLAGGLGNLGVHALISGFIELAAVVVPAMVALGAFAADWATGAMNVERHMMALRTATSATMNMFHTTAGQALGMGDALYQAQQKAQPQVYQALGTVLIGLQSHMHMLTTAGLQVGQIFDKFLAKTVVDLQSGAGKGITGLFTNMVSDLTRLAQIVGNVGHALLNLAADSPGVATVLLSILDAVSRLIEWLSRLPSWLVKAVILFHEFNLMGTLVTNGLKAMGVATIEVEGTYMGLGRAVLILRNILGVVPAIITRAGTAMFQAGGQIQNLGTTVTGASEALPILGEEAVAAGAGIGMAGKALAGAGDAVATFGERMTQAIKTMNPLGVVALAAVAVAAGYFIYKMVTAQTAAQKFAGSMNKMIASATSVQVFTAFGNAMSQSSIKIAGAQSQLAKFSTGGTVTDLARQFQLAMTNWSAFGDMITGKSPVLAAVANVNQFRAAQQQLGQEFLVTQGHAASLAREYHTGLVGALVLAGDAGVHLGAALSRTQWAVAEMQIKGYVRGLGAMGQTTGAVGKDVLALGIQSALTATKVSALNQAWDQFMQMVTGGTSAFASFVTSLGNMRSVAGTTANNLGTATGTMNLSVSQFANSLKSFNSTGAAAWTNFDQVVGSTAPQVIDWLRTAGAAGMLAKGQFAPAVLGMIQPLMRLGQAVPAARRSLIALAQQSGMNITSWSGLKTAIHDTGATMHKTGDIILKTTPKLGNMASVAQNLGQVVNSLVTQTMAQAALKVVGFAGAVQRLAEAIHKYGANSWQAQQAAWALSNKQREANNLVSQETGVWARVSQGVGRYSWRIQQLTGLLHRLTSTPYTVRVNMLQMGGIMLPGMSAGTRIKGAYASGTHSAAPGMALVGEKGPELVVMHGGEHVIPHEATRHLMGMTHGVKGYAAGTTGIMAELARVIANALARITGTFKSPPPVMGEISHLISLIDSAAKKHDITGSTKSSLTTFLLHDNTRLSALAHQRDLILKRIHAAQQYANSVQSAAAGTGSLSTLTQNGPQSSGSILAGMNQALAGIREFGSDIRRLEHMGLDRNLLNQIIQMGPVQGAQVAQALLNGPMSNISAMNSTESQIQSASKGLGKSAANMMYDSGKHAGHGFLSGLKAQEAALDGEMRHLAMVMVRTLDRGLGFRVPAMHHAHHGAAHITAALRHEAGHLPSALRHAAGGGHSGEPMVIHTHMLIELDGRELYNGVQEQALRVNRRNPANNLSLNLGRGRMG